MNALLVFEVAFTHNGITLQTYIEAVNEHEAKVKTIENFKLPADTQVRLLNISEEN